MFFVAGIEITLTAVGGGCILNHFSAAAFVASPL
jgi:hypothetical protein